MMGRMKKTITLKAGNEMPALGFGTWKLGGDVCKKAVSAALEAGYRHIDTAERYENHADIAAAIEASGVEREDVFITTKLWMTDYRRDDAYRACQLALQELKSDYIDLYLMHWPDKDRTVPMAETLGALMDLKKEGMVRAIGVSNFTVHHLEDALATGAEISVNQVEFHPSFYQRELKRFCDDRGIALVAYSPLAQGTEVELPLMKELGLKYGRSPAQVVLNWIVGKGVGAIPKATDPASIRDNLATLEWELSAEDVERIDSLGLNNRVFNPQFADFEY